MFFANLISVKKYGWLLDSFTYVTFMKSVFDHRLPFQKRKPYSYDNFNFDATENKHSKNMARLNPVRFSQQPFNYD